MSLVIDLGIKEAMMRWCRICGLTLLFLLLTSHPIHAYERDVHYDLTKYLVRWAGFPEDEAEQVATADQEIDAKPEFNPLPNPNFCPELRKIAGPASAIVAIPVACKNDPEFQRMVTAQRAYHFVDSERLQALRESAFQGRNLKILGHYLHALQDSFAHSLMDYADLPLLDKLVANLGRPPDAKIIGHLLYGHGLDKTYERPDLAEQMARYVYMELRCFRDATDQWSKIRPSVAKFVREQDLEKKLAHLALSSSTHQTSAPDGLVPAQFLLEDHGEGRLGSCSTFHHRVLGMIPGNPDFRDKEVAERYLSDGLKFFLEQCSSYLQRECEERNCPGWWHVGVVLAHARYVDLVDKSVRPRREEAAANFMGRFGEAPNQAKQTSIHYYAQKRHLFRDTDRVKVNSAENRAGATAKYRIGSKHPNYCNKRVPEFDVVAEVPTGLDLGDHELASAYLTTGLKFGLGQCGGLSDEPGCYTGLMKKMEERIRNKECPDGNKVNWKITVVLFQDGEEKVQASWVRPALDPTAGISVFGYKNLIAERKHAEEKAKEQAEKAKREAEQKEAAQRPIKERFDAFFRNHRADEAVSCESLERNPFAMEGKTLVMRLRFEQMIAKDQAVLVTGNFLGGGCAVLVSGVPQGTFSTQRVEALLAGKVLGNTKVSLGPVTLQVPHLRFGGLYVCKAENCADIIPNR